MYLLKNIDMLFSLKKGSLHSNQNTKFLTVLPRCATLADCRLADLQTCRPADLQTCRLADLQTCRLVDLQTWRVSTPVVLTQNHF